MWCKCTGIMTALIYTLFIFTSPHEGLSCDIDLIISPWIIIRLLLDIIAWDVLCLSDSFTLYPRKPQFPPLLSLYSAKLGGQPLFASFRRQMKQLFAPFLGLRKKQVSTTHQTQEISGPLVYLRRLEVFPDQILLQCAPFQSSSCEVWVWHKTATAFPAHTARSFSISPRLGLSI